MLDAAVVIDPAVAATVGISAGTLLLGFLLGALVSRRGRRLKVDWRLSVETEDTHRDVRDPHERDDEGPPHERRDAQ